VSQALTQTEVSRRKGEGQARATWSAPAENPFSGTGVFWLSGGDWRSCTPSSNHHHHSQQRTLPYGKPPRNRRQADSREPQTELPFSKETIMKKQTLFCRTTFNVRFCIL